MSSAGPHRERDKSPEYIFSSLDLCSPLEELERHGEKKIARFAQLGDQENADLNRRALEIAVEQLTVLLDGGGPPVMP